MSRKLWLDLFLVLCVSWHAAFAQLTGGTVVGNVNDPSGALVPDSEITIKNTSNGTELNTVSSKEGIFTFGAVSVGQYGFTATAKGFRTATGNFVVVLNTVRTVNVVLQVGESTQRVEVTDAGAPVETTSSQLTDSFARRQHSA